MFLKREQARIRTDAAHHLISSPRTIPTANSRISAMSALSVKILPSILSKRDPGIDADHKRPGLPDIDDLS